MNLYIDDNTCKALLVTLLRKAGHRVTIPSDIGSVGATDARHLVHAIKQVQVTLTKVHNDFEDLHLVVHASHGQHPGILAIRLDNDTSRDMKDRDIVRAIGNLERAGVPMTNEFHVLNHWR